MLVTGMEFIGTIFIFLFSLVIHENAHARVAYYLGDPTAKNMGRFSFNPLKHLDLIGILLPILLYLVKAPLISFAKPVMCKQSSFKRPKIDMIIVGLAGPVSNFILAIMGLFLYNRLSILPETILLHFNKYLITMSLINFILCAFNLIPIPPLDGSVLYMSTLTEKKPEVAKILQDYGLGVLVTLVIIVPVIGEACGKDCNIISHYIKWFIDITSKSF